MRFKRKILPISLALVLLLSAPPARAVFNEKDITRTLKVLRYELAKAYTDMERSQAGFEAQQDRQHEDLIKLVKDCDELSLMLYSQKQDFTFDLTYALRRVTDQYRNFSESKIPFDNIVSYLDIEIDRHDRLLKSLKIIPPELMSVPDSLGPSLLGMLAMTLHFGALTDLPVADMKASSGTKPQEEPLFDFQLDSAASVDRDSCIFYATGLLDMYTAAREMLVKDKEYYETTDNRLKEAYDYAQNRYKLIQKRIFVEGQRDYWYVLTHLKQFTSKALSDYKDKYSRDFHGQTIRSEWRGPIVIGFSFIILIYLFLAALVSWLATKGLKRRVSLFKTAGFANKELVFNLLVALALFVFLLLLAGASPKIGTNFFKMASSLLIEYSLLLITLSGSMLVRSQGSQLNRSLFIYIPVLALGLLVIAFRIIFIPNSLINLVFPPVLLLFLWWQWSMFRKHSDHVAKADRALVAASLVVTALTMLLSLAGYALMGLQLYIWWIFQLAVLQIILAIKKLLEKYRSQSIDKRVRAYRMMHPSEIGGKEASFLVTWLYDLFDMALIPVMIVFSFPACLYMASRVFDLTEICRTAFFYPFLTTNAITLSLYKVLLAIALFFLFRYIEYAARSLYRVFRFRDYVSKSGNGLIRSNEVNLTLANNVIWLLSWGAYVLVMIGVLKIPTRSISVVAAGLAAGMGFAMKDILNNFFYGVQLMSGRLRVGDTIECDGIRGTVDNISYQTTTIRALEGSLIAFPNATLFSKTFKNLTRSDSYEYVSLPVGVAYGTDVDKARKVISRALKPLCMPDKFGRDTVKPSYGIQVTLGSFGDSSVDLNVKQFVLVDQRYAYIAKANELIYKALSDNGIEIPFPQRDVRIKQ